MDSLLPVDDTAWTELVHAYIRRMEGHTNHPLAVYIRFH